MPAFPHHWRRCRRLQRRIPRRRRFPQHPTCRNIGGLCSLCRVSLRPLSPRQQGMLATGADYRHRTDNRPCRQRRLSSAAHTLRGLSVDWRVRLGESPAPRPCRAAATQPFSLDFPYPFRRGSRTAGQNPCRHPRRSLDRAVHHRLYHSAAPTRPYRRARIIGVAPPPRPFGACSCSCSLSSPA